MAGERRVPALLGHAGGGEARRTGRLDYFWVTEHHFFVEISHVSSPELFLAAVAQHTSKIRLGHAIVVLPVNHLFQVCERINTLDILSNGRAEFGTGRGSAPYELGGFKLDPAETRDMCDEALTAICRMWEHEKFPGFQGRYYDLPERHVIPRPVQRPHPPIWVAASQPSTFALAASRGLGVLGLTLMPPDELVPAVQAYRDAEKGAQPYGQVANHQIAAFAPTFVDQDDARGRRIACEATRWYLGASDNRSLIEEERFGGELKGDVNKYCRDAVAAGKDRRTLGQTLTDEQLVESGMVCGGNVDTICRTVEKWANVGFDQLMMMPQMGHTSHEDIMRALELLGTHVLPKFQDRPTVAVPRQGATDIDLNGLFLEV
ncbi:MAG: LLM class flavin-dependent oxidoreductase [Chloroflexi bacterium]|nr:LLM class flavin-dependent oxidoreductase [Chloroflexota bacterium]